MHCGAKAWFCADVTAHAGHQEMMATAAASVTGHPADPPQPHLSETTSSDVEASECWLTGCGAGAARGSAAAAARLASSSAMRASARSSLLCCRSPAERCTAGAVCTARHREAIRQRLILAPHSTDTRVTAVCV